MVSASSYFILAGLWLFYFGLHSLLASAKIKKKVRHWLGRPYRYYRLFYTIFAVLTIIPVLLYNATVSSDSLIASVQVRHVLQFVGLVLATYGVIVIRLSFKQYSARKFLGLSSSEEGPPEPLRTDGILRSVRHPLYAGTILIVLGLECFSPTLANLITALIWIAYILIGVRLEERKLRKLYGDGYQRYRERVPGLIPRLGKKAKR